MKSQCSDNYGDEDGLDLNTYIEKNKTKNCTIDGSKDFSHHLEIANCKPNRIIIRITASAENHCVVYDNGSNGTSNNWEEEVLVIPRVGRNCSYRTLYKVIVANSISNSNKCDLNLEVLLNEPVWNTDHFRSVTDLHLVVVKA